MNSWMFILNHECLTSEGRKMIRFLVQNAAFVIRAGIPTPRELVTLKKTWVINNPTLLSEADRKRCSALRNRFAWQIRQLILHRLVADDLLQYELDQFSDGTEAIALMRVLEEFLRETELKVLAIQNACVHQVDRIDLAA